jgi:hypothetical protein
MKKQIVFVMTAVLLIGLACVSEGVVDPTSTPVLRPQEAIQLSTVVPVRSSTVVPKKPEIHTSIDGEFNGWAGETVFKLSNGQLWEQTEFDLYVTARISPSVTLTTNGGLVTLTVDSSGESVEVQQITKFYETCILNDFNSPFYFTGWRGDTIFEMCNGDVWQQSSLGIQVTTVIAPPDVIIYESAARSGFRKFKMKVEGIRDTISVVQLR